MSSPKTSPVNIRNLITQTEAGKLRNVSRTTIHNYVLSGRLNSVKIGDKIFVYRGEVMKLKVRHVVRTDKEVLTDVRRVAKELGRTPNSSEYKRHGRIHLSSACRRFGNWANLVSRLESSERA